MASTIGMLGKAGRKIISEGGKIVAENGAKAAGAVGKAHEAATLTAARKLKSATKGANNFVGRALNESASETTSKIAMGRLAKESWFGKAADDIAFAGVHKTTLMNYASDLNLSRGGSKAQIIDRINNSDVVKEAIANVGESAGEVVDSAAKSSGKAVKNGITKNSLIGAGVGALVGGGAGGLAGVATGADDDNTKAMIVTGALAGGLGGAVIGGGSKMIRNKKASGSFFAQTTDDALKAAEQMATEGGKNAAVKGGAKGLMAKAGASVQSIPDKIDKIGYNVQHKYTGAKGREASKIIAEMQEAGDFNTIDKEAFIEGLTGGIKRKGATLGGAAQGAIMGSVSGAVVGGVAGGIDEDDTFIGGALKGGLIGGTLGGIGGGVSGYFNNNAKLLANTTANVNSLLGK